MPYANLTGREMVCRFDMIELFVKKTRENLERRNILLNDFVQDLADHMREPTRLYEQGGRLRHDFYHEDERIILRWPLESQMNNDLLRIRIVNTCKWDWIQHHGYIQSVDAFLGIHKIEYGISKAEIAFDTLSEEVARDFATSVSLKWGRPERLFNYASKKHRNWGSIDGFEEYMFLRKSPRQSHSYISNHKAVGLRGQKENEIFYRWELKFRRSYLKRIHIETIDDLFGGTRSLIENSLTFKRLNRTKLNREIPRAKDWRLSGKSIPEQMRMLLRHGLSRTEINRFFVRLEGPEICYTTEEQRYHHPGRLEYALWRAYVEHLSVHN